MSKALKQFFQWLYGYFYRPYFTKKSFQSAQEKVRFFIHRYAVILIFGSLLVFVGLVVAAIVLKPEPEVAVEPDVAPLEVSVVRFGDGEISEDTVGRIENKNSLQLVAQSSGPVKSIAVTEGEQVWRGTVLLSQESAYAAGNSAYLQSQIAQENYTLADETLKNTVESVAKTREQADKSRDNTEELRQLSEDAVDDTKSFITTLETQVSQLQEQIDAAGTTSDKTTLRASLLSAQSLLNSNRASLRQLEYEVDTDNPPTSLANIAKDLVYKATEIQLKSAEIQKNIAGLNLKMAQIAAAATQVRSPIEGTVERVFVNEGDYVTPGTPVAVVTGQPKLLLSIGVSGSLAQRVDIDQPLVATIAQQEIALPIAHVSSAPTQGQLYEVLALIPEGMENRVFENESIQVQLPLYSLSLTGGNYYLPLDSIFITNTDTFVYLEESGVAVKKSVEIGEIQGSSVEILSGISPGEVVILDRRVIDKQQVTPVFLPANPRVIEELG